MSASIFISSKPVTDMLARIAALEAAGSSVPGYNLKAEVRAITGYTDDDRVICLENDYKYKFDDASVLVDNNDNILKPNDIVHPAPGRWLKEAQYSVQGHAHAGVYIPVVPGANGYLAKFKADGAIESSSTTPGQYAKKPESYVEGHLSEFDAGGDLYDTGLAIEDLNPGSVMDTKMDKIIGMAGGDVGKVVILAADGNAAKGQYHEIEETSETEPA